MESYLAELQRVSRAVLAVSRQLSTRDALGVIVGSARTLVGARYAALGVPDDGGSFAEFVVAGLTQAAAAGDRPAAAAARDAGRTADGGRAGTAA